MKLKAVSNPAVGSMKRLKMRGPSTDPWGAPCDRGVVMEVKLFVLRGWYWLVDPE